MEAKIRKITACAVLLLALASSFFEAWAEPVFYRVEELERLLEAAEEAGMTEEVIRDMTVEDGDKVIRIWDYIQAYRKKEREAEEARQKKQKQVFLTPEEIFKALQAEDFEDLSRLRTKIAE